MKLIRLNDSQHRKMDSTVMDSTDADSGNFFVMDESNKYCSFEKIVSLPVLSHLWHYIVLIYHFLKKVPILSLFVIILEFTIKYCWKLSIAFITLFIGKKSLHKIDQFICTEVKKTEDLIKSIAKWIYAFAKKRGIVSLLNKVYTYIKKMLHEIAHFIEKIIHYFYKPDHKHGEKDIWQEIKAFAEGIEKRIIAFAKKFEFDPPVLGRSTEPPVETTELSIRRIITFLVSHLEDFLYGMHKYEMPSTWLKFSAIFYGGLIHLILTAMKHLHVVFTITLQVMDKYFAHAFVHMAGTLLTVMKRLVTWLKREEGIVERFEVDEKAREKEDPHPLAEFNLQ